MQVMRKCYIQKNASIVVGKLFIPENVCRVFFMRIILSSINSTNREISRQSVCICEPDAIVDKRLSMGQVMNCWMNRFHKIPTNPYQFVELIISVLLLLVINIQ